MRRILREIDTDYFFDRLLEPPASGLSPHGTNGEPDQQLEALEDVHRAILGYVKTSKKQRIVPRQQLSSHELRQVAEGVGGVGLTKLLQLVVIAAINGPGKQGTLERMASFPDSRVKLALMDTIKGFSMGEGRDAKPSDENGEVIAEVKEIGGRSGKDEFEYEAELGRQAAERKSLEDRMAQMQEQLEQQATELEILREGDGRAVQASKSPTKGKKAGAIEVSQLKEMQKVWSKQENVIVDLEHRLHESREENSSLNRMIEGLQASKNAQQKLIDDLDAMRVERDSLAKKASTFDRYKGKLEAHRKLELEVVELRRQLEAARQNTTDEDDQDDQDGSGIPGTSSSIKVLGLMTTIDQLRTTISRIEKDYDQEASMRRTAQQQNQELQAHIRDLQEQHRDLLADLDEQQLQQGQQQRYGTGTDCADDGARLARLSLNSAAFTDSNSPTEGEPLESERRVRQLEEELVALRAASGKQDAEPEEVLQQRVTDLEHREISLRTQFETAFEARVLAEVQRDALLNTNADADEALDHYHIQNPEWRAPDPATVQLVGELQALLTERAAAHVQIDSLKAAAQEQAAHVQQLATELLALAQDSEAARVRIVREALESTRLAHQADLKRLSREARTQAAESEWCSERLAGIIVERAGLQRRVAALGDKGVGLEAENKNLRSVVGALEEGLEGKEDEECEGRERETKREREVFRLLREVVRAGLERARVLEVSHKRRDLGEIARKLLADGLGLPQTLRDAEATVRDLQLQLAALERDDEKAAVRHVKERAREEIVRFPPFLPSFYPSIHPHPSNPSNMLTSLGGRRADGAPRQTGGHDEGATAHKRRVAYPQLEVRQGWWRGEGDLSGLAGWRRR